MYTYIDKKACKSLGLIPVSSKSPMFCHLRLKCTCNIHSVIHYFIKCTCLIQFQVDCIVTTAGGVEEDFIKCMAPTYLGDFALKGKMLRERGINRIGNLLVPNDNYCSFEDWVMPILDQMLQEQKEQVYRDLYCICRTSFAVVFKLINFFWNDLGFCA